MTKGSLSGVGLSIVSRHSSLDPINGNWIMWKSVRNAVVGGGQTEQVFSEDLATKFSMVKFSLPSTEDSAKLVREWKNNLNNNVVELQSSTGGAQFTRIFTQASIQGNPEVNLSTDGSVEIEFMSNPAQ